MTIAAGLIVSRFVHYLALSVLFGGALFPFYGFARPQTDTQRVPAWMRALLLGAALLAWLSGISWFVFTTAGMSGTLSGVTDPAILCTMIRAPAISGRVWVLPVLNLASALALLAAVSGAESSGLARCDAVVSRFLSFCLTRVSRCHRPCWKQTMGTAGLRHRVADAFHLVAAGVWTGALVVLARLVMMAYRELRDDDLRTLHQALSRFSGIGTESVVATLVADRDSSILVFSHRASKQPIRRFSS